MNETLLTHALASRRESPRGDRRDAPRAHHVLARVLLVLGLLGSAVETRAETTVRLLPEDSLTIHVVVKSDAAFRGGEIALRYASDALVFEEATPGEDFPGGNPPTDLPATIHVNSAPELARCPDDPTLDAAVAIAWLHPATEASPDAPRTLAGDRAQRVLVLRFSRAPDATPGDCASVRFADCLGSAVAPARNVLTDAEGRSVPLTTIDRSVCDTACRVLRFAPAQRTSCDSVSLELLEADGATRVDLRDIVLLGSELPDGAVTATNGFDLAQAIARSYGVNPLSGFTFAALDSELTICRESGELFVVRIDGSRLRPGVPVLACDVDTEIDLPSCPDRDGDGSCDADDCEPDVFNASQDACPSPGFCRRVKFDPLCAFRCDSLSFELREVDDGGADGLGTPIAASRRTVSIGGNGTGRDIGVEFCRAYRQSPPPGFTAHASSSGCTLCRTDGTAFRIVLEHERDLDGTIELVTQEITVGGVTAACGLRVWAQPPDCADRDLDGVCDLVDRCPDDFDPSQADLDGDCVGDACQTVGGLFEIPARCDGVPVDVAAGDAIELTAELGPCSRGAACFSFRAPPGRAVLLGVRDSRTSHRSALYLQWGREATPLDFFASARRGGSSVQRLVTGTRDGIGFVLVTSSARSESSVLTLRIEVPDLALESLEPTRGAPGTRLSAAIRGEGLGRELSYRLRAASGASIDVGDIEPVSSTRNDCVLTIPAGAIPGTHYDLVAVLDGVPLPPLVDAFEVVSFAEASGLDVSLSFADFYRQGVVSRGTLRLRNLRAEEIPAPMIEITTRFTQPDRPGANLGPTATDLRLLHEPVDLEASDLHRRRLLVLGANPRGVAGRLPPGAEIEIPIVLRNVDPRCFFCTTTFEARVLTPIPGDPVGWESLATPAGLSDDEWGSLWPALSVRLGGTWPEVHERLADIATRIGRRGRPATSVRELFRFAAREALGRPVAAIAGRLRSPSSLSALADTVVIAVDDTGEVRGSATTDTRGRFAVDGLRPATRYRLRADRRAGELAVTTPASGDLLDVALELGADIGSRARPCASCDSEGLPDDAVFPPGALLTLAAEKRTIFVGSFDPNEKFGPDGVGDEDLLGSGAELVYTIYFENLPNARAAAREVVITDVIHPNLDFSSLRLLSAGVAGSVVHLDDADPYGSIRQPLEHLDDVFSVPLDFQLDVDVEPTTRTITWRFTTIGRATGRADELNDDVFAGFLPPNDPRPDGQGLGEGWVSFSIGLGEGLEDGDPVSNRASIRFDGNASIVTAAVENRHSLFLPAEPARNPRPEDSLAPRVPLDTALAWEATPHAKRWNVQLWRVEEGGARTPLEISGTGLSRPAVTAPRLEFETTYEWRVDAVNVLDRVTPGELWSFRTVPAPPPCPGAPVGLLVEAGDCAARRPALLHWERPAAADPEDPIIYAVLAGPDAGRLELVANGLRETHLEMPGSLSPGEHVWQVVAMTGSCPTVASAERSATGPSFVACPAPDGLVSFVRADTNCDRRIDITDAVVSLNFLFVGGRAPCCFAASDVDENLRLDITDAVRILSFLFTGGAPIPPPNRCDEGPRAERVDCAESTCRV